MQTDTVYRQELTFINTYTIFHVCGYRHNVQAGHRYLHACMHADWLQTITSLGNLQYTLASHTLSAEGVAFESIGIYQGTHPAGTAAAGLMLEAKLMNLIKSRLQKFRLSNNFSVKFTRSCASAASPDQSWYASDVTVYNIYFYVQQ